MSADDDTELRDLVIDSLEKKGVLGKIKAELRATVFLALEENERDLGNGDRLHESRSQQELYKFLSTEKGIMTLSLVQDFLQQFHLDFSLAVLEPEASSPRKCIPRNELESLLKLYPDSDSCCPLLGLLLSKNQSVSINNTTDENGNASQVTKKTATENGVEIKTAFDDEFNHVPPHTKKAHSESRSNQSILSKLPDDDPFFDDPLPISKTNSLLFNYPAKTGPRAGDLQPLQLSSLLDESKESKASSDDDKFAADDHSDGEPKKSSFGMSSLRGLPSLTSDPHKPKEEVSALKELELPISVSGRRQWKDTDPEQRERFMSLTFGNKSGLSENFPSPDGSIGGADGKEAAGLEPEHSDPLEQEASIEENIEEDLSALADDLLISDTSSKDENVTLDESVSTFSKAGKYDYMEQL